MHTNTVTMYIKMIYNNSYIMYAQVKEMEIYFPDLQIK